MRLLIDELISLARRFFPDDDALGKRVTYDDPSDAQARWGAIVGIVADTQRDEGIHADGAGR